MSLFSAGSISLDSTFNNLFFFKIFSLIFIPVAFQNKSFLFDPFSTLHITILTFWNAIAFCSVPLFQAFFVFNRFFPLFEPQTLLLIKILLLLILFTLYSTPLFKNYSLLTVSADLTHTQSNLSILIRLFPLLITYFLPSYSSHLFKNPGLHLRLYQFPLPLLSLFFSLLYFFFLTLLSISSFIFYF
jgi:hypothetical protein